MATVICKTYDGVERTVTVEAENTCPLYSYGETHKEFIGIIEKPSAPNNPAYYNAPAFTTPIAPPEQNLEKLEYLMRVLKLGVKLLTLVEIIILLMLQQ